MEWSFVKDGVVVEVLVSDEKFAKWYAEENGYTPIHYKRNDIDAHMGWHTDDGLHFYDPNYDEKINGPVLGLEQPVSAGMKEI